MRCIVKRRNKTPSAEQSGSALTDLFGSSQIVLVIGCYYDFSHSHYGSRIASVASGITRLSR
jgi:hypothetical protein